MKKITDKEIFEAFPELNYLKQASDNLKKVNKHLEDFIKVTTKRR